MAEEDKTIGARGSRRPAASDAHATGKAGSPRPASGSDPHATGKAGNRRPASNPDTHATGKAVRGEADAHSTGKATRNVADEHATGKTERGNQNSNQPRPYEVGDRAFQKTLSNKEAETHATEWPDFFEFDGKKYKNEGVLSASSGEAIVFTVTRDGKKYALKIYYYDPEHRPNHQVLEKIRKLSGSGLVVPLISHGEWENPNHPGEKNDYELMEFCEGGSLDGVILEGDEKALTEVAVKMGAAIDFLAKHGILHRDIKPANFFYLDKEKTRIVLADFGISVECPEGSYVKIDEMRSPVYAAPEFYTNVPGEPAEVGVESDYFSLGVALLCLWMGKDKLTANESALLRAKLNENLPMPKDMSSHMASLITALTRLKMADRATFDDIKHWVKGEELISEKSESNFHVVFNSAKNQVANSPAELARYLVEDDALGKKYLYSGRVTRWLEETGRNEVAVNVEEIVEERYPEDQDGGLWTAAYLLDPAMEYVSPQGDTIEGPGQLTVYVAENAQDMADEILLTDTRLKIYLRALGLNEVVEAIEDYAETLPEDMGDGVKSLLVGFYLAILMAPSLPLPLYSAEKESVCAVHDIKSVLEILHSNGEDFGYFNWFMLVSPAFVLWLAQQDPALAGKIRMLLDNVSDDPESVNFNANNAYRVAYELDPSADYYFNTDLDDPNRCYSIESLGEMMENLMAEMASGDLSLKPKFNTFLTFEESRVADFLRSRGKNYMTFLSWMLFCTADSKDNYDKPGPYNIVVGVYKGITGFLGRQPYYPLDGERIYEPDELLKMPRDVVRASIEKGQHTLLNFQDENDEGIKQRWLQAWLTVFFQEDPKLDLTKRFTYENKTVEYLDFLSEFDPDNFYVERYNEAISEIDDAATTLKKSYKGVNFGRWFFWITCGIPSLVMIIALLINGLPDTVNPIKGHIVPTFIICAIGAFIFNAAMWGPGFWTTIVPSAVVGAVLTAVFYAAFAWFPGFLAIAILVVLAILLIWKSISFIRLHETDTGGVTIRGDEFEFRQLDALYYAYKDINLSKENVITKYSDLQVANNKTNRSNIWFDGWRWAGIVWMLFVLWYFWTPGFSGDKSWVTEQEAIKAKSGQWVLGTWKVKYGGTTIVCNIDSINPDDQIFGTMIIAGQAPVEAHGKVWSENDTLPEMFRFWPDEMGYGKQTLEATYNKGRKVMEGHYYDRKKIMNQVNFIQTPLSKTSTSSATDSSTPVKKKTVTKKKVENSVDSEQEEQASSTQEEPSEKETKSSGNILGEDTLY